MQPWGGGMQTSGWGHADLRVGDKGIQISGWGNADLRLGDRGMQLPGQDRELNIITRITTKPGSMPIGDV